MSITIVLSLIVILMTTVMRPIHGMGGLMTAGLVLAIAALAVSIAGLVLGKVKKSLKVFGTAAKAAGMVLSAAALVLVFVNELNLAEPKLKFKKAYDVSKAGEYEPAEITWKDPDAEEEEPGSDDEKKLPDYSEAYKLIEAGKYDEAQSKIDDIHYSAGLWDSNDDGYNWALIALGKANGQTYYLPSYYDRIQNKDNEWYESYLDFMYDRSEDDYVKQAVNAAWNYPENPAILCRAALAMVKEDNFEAACYFFEKATTFGDPSIPSHYIYAASAYISGDFETAASEFEIVKQNIDEIENEEYKTIILEDIERAEADMEGK